MVRFLAGLWPIIALAFPLLELAGIITVWHQIGAWTLLLLLASVFAGSSLIAAERLAFMPRMASVMAGGANPFAVLKGSGLRFLAGALLIFPGFISDGIALILLLWSQTHPAPTTTHWAANDADHDAGVERDTGAKPEGGVIEGEFKRMD
jgi:UPF0716 protein FxsA